MARGKIQIKRIENVTNRQVTYSKRRNGLKKKAHELTVLCDAKVSLLMVSSSGKLFEFVSQSTTTKKMLDEYQKDRGIDIWKSHYGAMLLKLKELEEMNKNLRRQIGQRLGVGDCLKDLDLVELHTLEQEMDEAVTAIRNRKIKHLSNQIETKKKKLRNAKQFNSLYEYEFEAMDDELQYELAANARDYYESVYSPNQDPRNLFSLRLHAQGSLHPPSGGVSDITTYNLL